MTDRGAVDFAPSPSATPSETCSSDYVSTSSESECSEYAIDNQKIPTERPSVLYRAQRAARPLPQPPTVFLDILSEFQPGHFGYDAAREVSASSPTTGYRANAYSQEAGLSRQRQASEDISHQPQAPFLRQASEYEDVGQTTKGAHRLTIRLHLGEANPVAWLECTALVTWGERMQGQRQIG